MSKRGYEASAALVGFDLVVPAPAPKADADPEGTPKQAGGSYEDSWYRTLRATAGLSRGDEVEREGALGESAAEPPSPPALTVAPPPSTPASEADGASEYVATQKSADSYEDSWYQILKSRQVAGVEE
jgi:hypothetical protein